MHSPGRYDKYYGLAMALANGYSCFNVGAEVYVVAAAFVKAGSHE